MPPTAQASLALLALTAFRLALNPMLGVGVHDHALPFQRYAAGAGGVWPARPDWEPTAHPSVGVRIKPAPNWTVFGLDGRATLVQAAAADAPSATIIRAVAQAPTAAHRMCLIISCS